MFGWIIIVLLVLAALGWTFLVVLANGMSDAPTMAFQGTWSVGGAWAVVLGAIIYKVWV